MPSDLTLSKENNEPNHPKDAGLFESIDSLSEHNPYRYPSYHPSGQLKFDRELPSNAHNLMRVQQEWDFLMDEDAIAHETEKTRAMTYDEKAIEGIIRLGLGYNRAIMTLTFFSRIPEIYKIITQHPYIAHLMNSKAALYVGSYGAGYLDLNKRERRFDLSPLKEAISQFNGPTNGIVIEPYEILLMLLSQSKNGILEIYDLDPKVIHACSKLSSQYVYPISDFFGTSYQPQSIHDLFSREFVRRAGGTEKDRFVMRNNAEAYHLTIPRELLDKTRTHFIDLSTELLPVGPKQHISFYLQTAYLMDPLLQRTSFIKILHRLSLNGLLISDYLLTEAEMGLFGVRVVGIQDTDPYQESRFGNRDRFIYVYEKLGESHFAKKLYQRIEKVQATEQ